MRFKWKPSATQRRAFAEKMKDPAEAQAYEQRKRDKAEKRRSGSKYDYESAGGMYVPTQAQHDYAVYDRSQNTTPDHDNACNMVASAFACNEKCHHDYIHIVNELRRSALSSL